MQHAGQDVARPDQARRVEHLASDQAAFDGLLKAQGQFTDRYAARRQRGDAFFQARDGCAWIALIVRQQEGNVVFLSSQDRPEEMFELDHRIAVIAAAAGGLDQGLVGGGAQSGK